MKPELFDTNFYLWLIANGADFKHRHHFAHKPDEAVIDMDKLKAGIGELVGEAISLVRQHDHSHESWMPGCKFCDKEREWWASKHSPSPESTPAETSG